MLDGLSGLSGFGGLVGDLPIQLGAVAWYNGSSAKAKNANGSGGKPTANNDPVGVWGDLSGHGHDLAAGGSAARATLTLSAVNGLPGVTGDGAATLLALALTLPQPFIVACVTGACDVALGPTAWGNEDGSISQLLDTAGVNHGRWTVFGATQGTSELMVPIQAEADPAVTVALFNDAASLSGLYVNGVKYDTAPTPGLLGGDFQTTLNVFQDGSGNKFKGTLAEMVVLPVGTNAISQALSAWLNAKYHVY